MHAPQRPRDEVLCLFTRRTVQDAKGEVYSDDKVAPWDQNAAPSTDMSVMGVSPHQVDANGDPKTYRNAVSGPNSQHWRDAAEKKLNALAREYRLTDAAGTRSPIASGQDNEDKDTELLPQRKSTFVNITQFQRMVGSLLWLYRCTRADIGFAVHHLSRKMHAPSVTDWELGKRTVQYLKGARDLQLHFAADLDAKDKTTITAYSDADHTGDEKDRQSVTGGVMRVNGYPMRKQTCMLQLTMEAEFVAATTVIQEMT